MMSCRMGIQGGAFIFTTEFSPPIVESVFFFVWNFYWDPFHGNVCIYLIILAPLVIKPDEPSNTWLTKIVFPRDAASVRPNNVFLFVCLILFVHIWGIQPDSREPSKKNSNKQLSLWRVVSQQRREKPDAELSSRYARGTKSRWKITRGCSCLAEQKDRQTDRQTEIPQCRQRWIDWEVELLCSIRPSAKLDLETFCQTISL